MTYEDDLIVSFKSPSESCDICLRESDSVGRCDHQIDQQQFHIRMANSERRREAASVLIKKMYTWRGYAVDRNPGKPLNKITLLAETGGIPVATMSLCLDGGQGLPADEHFRDNLDELRAQGRRLCEPSRLAIDKGVSKRVFAALIHISYIYSHNIHAFTDYLIEVNPRHVAFYKKMLGFIDFGSERNCSRVGAPAVLLRLDLSYMGQQIRKFGGLMEQHGTERSFYPFFFPICDEPGITSRLREGRN